MKIFIAFALLVASVSALPQKLSSGIDFNNERLVTDAIASAIQDVSQSIKDAGLDPVYIQHEEGFYALPVPVLFNAEGVVEEFLFHGLSDIVISSLSYSILTNRLRFEISLPLIETVLEKANLDVILFGEKYNAAAAGRLAIKNIEVTGDVRVSLGIISGISIRSLIMTFKLGGIESGLSVSVAGHDLSSRLNTFLGTKVPVTLNNFENEINELIEIVALEIINANL